MEEELLKRILATFQVTDEVLKEREEVGTYIQSLASLITDKFYDYLLMNEEFAQNIDESELPRLKRMRSESLVALFCEEFDEALLKKISVVYLDSPLRINDFILASVFETITQTILDIASVNTQLNKNLKTVLKFIRISEFVMQHALSKDISKHIQIDKDTTLRDIFESLYLMLIFHKEKHENLLKAIETKSVKRGAEKLPNASFTTCPFTELMEKIEKQFSDKIWLYKDLVNIKSLHISYHTNVAQLYELVEDNAKEFLVEQQVEIIKKISAELFETLSKPFESSASLTFLTIKSGMKFLKQYGSTLNEVKYIPYNNPNELILFVGKLLTDSLQRSLSWAIKEFDFSLEKPTQEWEIEEKIIFQNCSLYISIEIQDLPYKNFIIDTLQMFLEVFKITLINKEKEYTLTILADRAESANRSKDMFLANMSHELRTPLNAIIGFSQILQTKPEIPDPLKPYIEKISIAGNNLLNIVNTILDFAKLEAGKISFHPQMVLLSKLIQEIIVITSPLAEAKNIKLNFPSDVSLGLFIDEQLIKQVLINLLSNAVKFTQNDGEVTLDIKFDSAQKKYILSVCDNGVGMAKEDLAKLFQPFSQVDNSLQSSSKGTGLGLVITKRIVEDLHKGEIWVESELGKGSCFYFSIPVSNEHAKVEMFPSNNDKAKDLLIVEDSQEYVDILVEELNDKFNITVTNSIENAKELLEKLKYYRMILDFFLTDGISSDVLSFMEHQNIQVPTYLISAEDDFKIVEHIHESQNIVGVFNKKDTRLVCEKMRED